MGGWFLEVFKMALYVSFPVGLFHYFNSPGYIEEDLEKARKEYIDKYIGTKLFEKRRTHFEYLKDRGLAESKEEES